MPAEILESELRKKYMSLTFSLNDKASPKVISLVGSVDESAADALNTLKSLPKGTYSIDLAGILSINSIGVRNWLNFIKDFQTEREVKFSNCTYEFIRQVNMIPPFKGKGEIESFFAQFYCETCDNSFDLLFDAKSPVDLLRSKLSSQRCPSCSTISECVESPNEYLTFLEPK